MTTNVTVERVSARKRRRRMVAAHLAVLGFAAGRVWGVHALLRRRVAKGSQGRLARLYLKAS